MSELQAAVSLPLRSCHADELPGFGYYQQRRSFREELHPFGSAPFVMENVQIHCAHVADPPMRQAPLLGEQTAEIAAELSRSGSGRDRRAARARGAGDAADRRYRPAVGEPRFGDLVACP